MADYQRHLKIIHLSHEIARGDTPCRSWPDMELARAYETTIRAVAVLSGGRCELRDGAQNEAGAPSLPGRAEKRSGGGAVVTGRQSGLAASRAKGFAKKIVGARVMTRC